MVVVVVVLEEEEAEVVIEEAGVVAAMVVIQTRDLETGTALTCEYISSLSRLLFLDRVFALCRTIC